MNMLVTDNNTIGNLPVIKEHDEHTIYELPINKGRIKIFKNPDMIDFNFIVRLIENYHLEKHGILVPNSKVISTFKSNPLATVGFYYNYLDSDSIEDIINGKSVLQASLRQINDAYMEALDNIEFFTKNGINLSGMSSNNVIYTKDNKILFTNIEKLNMSMGRNGNNMQLFKECVDPIKLIKMLDRK